MAWLKKNTSEKPAKTPSLPQSLKAALNALDRDSLILDKNSNTIFKTNNVDKLNILKDSKINSEELSALVRVVRRTGVKQEGSFELPRGPIGEGKRELQVSVSMLSEAGLVLVMIDDEGEKQRIDAVRRDFITNISHELKTPITALSLNSDALLEIKNEPEQVVKFANKIKQQTGRLNDLVQEIINLSKLQDTDPMASAKEVQILDVVNEAIDQCETNAESHKITIDLEKSESAKVLGNREQLVMAVHNLIENAINYSPESTKVTVLIEVTEQIVEVTVKDQGIGIAQSEIDRIFERFYRVDQARSRATGGTGLGLSIVKHVAGIGSTFSLRLPIISKVARTSK